MLLDQLLPECLHVAQAHYLQTGLRGLPTVCCLLVNMLSTHMCQGFPAWQVLLVDLRCHGESANLPDKPGGPHTVDTAAADILTLLRKLRYEYGKAAQCPRYCAALPY